MHTRGYQSQTSGNCRTRKFTALTVFQVKTHVMQQQQEPAVFGAHQIAVDFVEDFTTSSGLDAG